MRSSESFVPAGRLRGLAYRGLWSYASALQRLADACLHAAAGLLRQADLQSASRIYWRSSGSSADDVDAGLEPWERRMYSSLLRPSDRVLLVGCGAGRDLLALREMGYDVSGLDPMPELVDRADQHLARRRLTAKVRQGFVETADIDGPYDVVVLAGCCYCYVRRSATRVETLARIRTQLSAQGRIAVVYAGSAARSPLLPWITRTVGFLTRADWHAERGDTFSRGYFVRRLLRYEHLFERGELARECAEGGLRIVQDETTTPFCYVIATSERDHAEG